MFEGRRHGGVPNVPLTQIHYPMNVSPLSRKQISITVCVLCAVGAASAQDTYDGLVPPTSGPDLPAVHGSLVGYPTAGDVGFAARRHVRSAYTSYEVAAGNSACAPSRLDIAVAKTAAAERSAGDLSALPTRRRSPEAGAPTPGDSAAGRGASGFAKTGAEVVPSRPPGAGDLR